MRERKRLTGTSVPVPPAIRPGGPKGSYAVLWSGGKDSCLALWQARRLGVPVGGLVNFFDESSGRVRFHAVRRGLVSAQATALGLGLFQFATSPDTYAEVFAAALSQLKEGGYEGVIGGDIHLEDVRAWVEARTIEAGLELIEPLWRQDGAAILRELVGAGFRAVLTCCDTTCLDASWLGREIDESFISAILRLAGIDPCGEHGEYHSFVFDGPLFGEPVSWQAGSVRQGGPFLQLDLLPGG